MGFLSDITTLITSDTSTNSFATGGIKFEHLPVNWDLTKNWLVFSYVEAESIDTLDANHIGSSFVLEVELISPTLSEIQSLTPTLNSYLLNYRDDNIKDISISEIAENYVDTERGIFSKTLRYDVLYLN